MSEGKNPYESPGSSLPRRGNLAQALPRIAALVLWLIAALLVWQSLAALRVPDIVARYESNPPLFVFILTVAIAFPILGIGCFGVASWQRSKHMVIAGAVAFLPLLITIIWLMARDALR